jgi:hypothetical protein
MYEALWIFGIFFGSAAIGLALVAFNDFAEAWVRRRVAARGQLGSAQRASRVHLGRLPRVASEPHFGLVLTRPFDVRAGSGQLRALRS